MNPGPQEPKTVWCAIYTRKSTDENMNSDFTSLDSQREYCEAFIKSRGGEGWKIYPERYDDPGFSGGNMDRPALKRLINEARQRKFHVTVSYKYDRLSRNTKDFLHILDLFDKNQVAFVSVTQPIDTTSSIGRLMRSILMDFAQFEREMISERTRDKISAMAKRGKRVGGMPVLGYDIDAVNKGLSINEHESKIAQEMFATYVKERSLSSTAKILNAKGYRLKQWVSKKGSNKGGGKFMKMNLNFLLRNPIYMGKIRYHDVLYPGEHKGIIDESVFAEVQKILSRNGERKRSENRNKHEFLLKSFLRCAACGSYMTPSHSRGRLREKYFYYRCTSVNRMDTSACAVASVPARTLEQFVMDRLLLLCNDKGVLLESIKETQTTTGNALAGKRKDKSRLAAELGKLEVERKNWMTILGEEGPLSSRREFLLEQIDEMSKKRKELQNGLLNLESEIIQLETRNLDADILQHSLGNFMEALGKISPKEQRDYIRLLLKEVVYDGVKNEVSIGFHPVEAFQWSLEACGPVLHLSKEELPD